MKPSVHRAARLLLFMAVLTCIAMVGVANAQSLFEFDRWMKVIEKRSLTVQRSLKAKDGPAANAAATEMRELYVRMEDYFLKQGVAQDAVVRTRADIDQLTQLTQKIEAGNYDAALKLAIKVASACRGCHLEHKPLD